MIIRRLFQLLAVAAALVVTAPSARATGPVRVAVDSTRVIAPGPDTCPFAIVSHVRGTFLFFEYPDGSSKITVAGVFVTWSNPLSGASLATPLAGPFIVSAPNPDGTVTVTIPGNDGRFVVPGGGVIFANVGLLVYLADPNDPSLTPLVILQASGIQDPSPFPAVCDALA
jgi:hypothetical protein